MARIIKINSNDKTYYINIDNIIKITPNFANPADKTKATTYSISFIDGSFLDNCKLSEEVITELHLG